MNKKRISNLDVVAKATEEMSELHAQTSAAEKTQRSGNDLEKQDIEPKSKSEKTPIRKENKSKSQKKEFSPPLPKSPKNKKKILKNRGITLPAELDELLNRVAFQRKMKHGGREGVSGIIVNLIEQHNKELEDELNN